MTVTPPEFVMSEADAERLTRRITLMAGTVREGVEKVAQLVDEAKRGNAHVALGYASWTAYLADTLGENPIRLDRDQRREIVGLLAGEGMSTRAIAPIVGVGDSTVQRDLAGAPNGAPVSDDTPTPEPDDIPEATEGVGATRQPSPHTGADQAGLPPYDPETGEVLDGNPAKVTGLDGKQYSRPEPKPRADNLPKQYAGAITALIKVTNQLRGLREHARFEANKKQIADSYLSDLLRAKQEINHHIQGMEELS